MHNIKTGLKIRIQITVKHLVNKDTPSMYHKFDTKVTANANVASFSNQLPLQLLL